MLRTLRLVAALLVVAVLAVLVAAPGARAVARVRAVAAVSAASIQPKQVLLDNRKPQLKPAACKPGKTLNGCADKQRHPHVRERAMPSTPLRVLFAAMPARRFRQPATRAARPVGPAVSRSWFTGRLPTQPP